MSNIFRCTRWTNAVYKAERMYPPEFVVLGGGSVTGKSVLTRKLLGVDSDNKPLMTRDSKGNLVPDKAYTHALARGFMLITPDFVNELVEYGNVGRHPEHEVHNVRDYYRTLTEMVLECLRLNIPVMLDDHCANAWAMPKLLKEVKIHAPRTQTALIGYFSGPDAKRPLFMMAEMARLRTPEKDRESRKAMKDRIVDTMEGFQHHFWDHTRLFDTTLLLENLYNFKGKSANVRKVARYVHREDEIEERILDKQGWRDFREESEIGAKIFKRTAVDSKDESDPAEEWAPEADEEDRERAKRIHQQRRLGERGSLEDRILTLDLGAPQKQHAPKQELPPDEEPRWKHKSQGIIPQPRPEPAARGKPRWLVRQERQQWIRRQEEERGRAETRNPDR